MGNGRCIIVLGTGRSGTSAVAGVLHRLGVSMGLNFIETTSANPYGTYEDSELYDLNRAVTEGKTHPVLYKEYIEKRTGEGQGFILWGMKDPALNATLQFIMEYLEGYDVRLIGMRRPAHECIRSYMRAYKVGRREATDWYKDVMLQYAARLIEFSGEVLDVDYNELLKNPTDEVEKIADFIYDGIPYDTDYMAGMMADAVSSLNPFPRKISTHGWGSLAIGTRISKHPEAEFFTSWTALLTGGVRNWDKVLLPALYMPAHHAANKLAKDFLRGNQDSLLLIDDDMTFDGDAVEKMRTNVATFDYDIVMGLCVKRNHEEPKPIVLQYLGRFGLPFDMRGDWFKHFTDFTEGDVVEVDAVGLGFTMIKRHVLEAMIDPEWGLENTFDMFTYGPGLESDDIPFSRKARELGFRMGIDTSANIGHIAHVPLSYKHYLESIGRGGDA